MEKRNRRTLLLKKKRPVRRGAASHVPQPKGISESPLRSEEMKKDLSAGQTQSWEDQWLDFLERVKSQGMLEEEEALWGEAKGLLASLEPETEACRGPRYEWTGEYEVEETLAVLPLELWTWLGERGLQNCVQVVALAEAFLWRQQESFRWQSRVAAGRSCSVVQKNLPGLGQEGDGQQSLLGRLMSDSENEGDQPRRLLEGGEEETLRGWESPRGREGNPTEEKMDKPMPCLGGTFQEQETEDGGARSPGTHSSSNPEEELDNTVLLEESNVQSRTSGCGALRTKGKPFLCLGCGKSFTRHYNLTLHQKIHRGEKPYQCSECGKSFSHKRNLSDHKRIHTREKPYECTHCGQSFRQKPHLTAHQAIHTGEKQYKCCVCGKSFRRKYTLIVHQKIHTGEKAHKCSMCEKLFRHMSSYIRHQKIHARENPYTCSECGKSFSRWESLKQHRTNSLEAGGDCSESQAERRAGTGGDAL